MRYSSDETWPYFCQPLLPGPGCRKRQLGSASGQMDSGLFNIHCHQLWAGLLDARNTQSNQTCLKASGISQSKGKDRFRHK